VIKPTTGRVVLFHRQKGDEPYAALVAYAHSDTCINVGGFDHGGLPFQETSVTLLQDDDPAPETGCYAEWMPYQKGQAAKTEALEAQAGKGAATA
jgi:hypothetical protein